MLTVGLALSCLLLSLLLVVVLWRSNQFHPAIFFLLFAGIDVFFPAAYWVIFGQVNNPEWLPALSVANILDGLGYYVVYLFIFLACLLAADGAKRPRLSDTGLSQTLQFRLLATLWSLLILTLIKMGLEVLAYGGLGPWFWSRIIFAAVSEIDGITTSGDIPLVSLPLRDILQATVGLAFFYRKQFKRRWIVTVLFPVIAIVLAMLTFLRGSVLTCAITLIFAEVMRHKSLPSQLTEARSATRRIRPLAIAILAGVLSIYVFGSIRDNFRGLNERTEDASVELNVPTFMTAGHGLLGLSHITSEYGRTVNFLWGKTYVDMMLLPIPRSIYTSKPAWYGIDDITRGMGWPETTQSAVTMPGEAFANFGFFGLLVAIPMGLVFGWLHYFVRSNQTRYLLIGPVLFFQIVSVANWMSFTGIMNAMPLVVLLVALAAFVGGKHSPSSRQKPLRRISKSGIGIEATG